MALSKKAIKHKSRAAARAAKSNEVRNVALAPAAPAAAAGAGAGAKIETDAEAKFQLDAVKTSEVRTKEEEKELENRKLEYIYRTCEARLLIKENLEKYLADAPLQELQNFCIRQYNVVFKGDVTEVRKKVLRIIKDHIIIYQAILEIFRTNAKDNIKIMIAMLFKGAAFSLPQYENHKGNNVTKLRGNDPYRENTILKNLYNVACSLLDKETQEIMQFFKNVTNNGSPTLTIEFEMLVQKLLEGLFFIEGALDVRIDNRFMPFIHLKEILLLVESGFNISPDSLKEAVEEDKWSKPIKEMISCLLLKEKHIDKQHLDVRVKKTYQTIKYFQHRDSGRFVLAEFCKLYDAVKGQSNAMKVSTTDGNQFGIFLKQVLPNINNLATYFVMTATKFKRISKEFFTLFAKIEEYTEQNKSFEAAKMNVDNLWNLLIKTAEKNSEILNATDTDLEYIKQQRKKSEEFLASIIKAREAQILKFLNTSIEEIQAIGNATQRLSQIVHGEVQDFFNCFAESASSIAQYHQWLRQFYADILIKIRPKAEVPVQGRVLQIQSEPTAEVTSDTDVVKEKPKKSSSFKERSVSLEEWKKDVESKRQISDEERKKRHQNAAAEAIVEARNKQAAMKLAFELSAEALKTREDHIVSVLKVTKPIQTLFTTLYANPCDFSCNDLMQLVDSLKQKGFLIDIEYPGGGSSHFTVYICMDEYIESGGAFVMEDRKAAYPKHIIDGLRQAFTRAGFTPFALKLSEGPAAAGNMLLAYPLAQQQMQLQAGASAARAVASPRVPPG